MNKPSLPKTRGGAPPVTVVRRAPAAAEARDNNDDDELYLVRKDVLSRNELQKALFSYSILIFLLTTCNNLVDIMVDVLEVRGTWTAAAARAVGVAIVYAFLLLTVIVATIM